MPRERYGKIYYSGDEAADKLRVPFGTIWRHVRDAELHITQLDVFRDGKSLYISQSSLRRIFDQELADDNLHPAPGGSAPKPSRSDEAVVQFYSCFISYSHTDQPFAFRLHNTIEGCGVRCWLDVKQLLPGDPIDTVFEVIRRWDKVLLCCSEQALNSWWVDNEIRAVLEKEEQLSKQPFLSRICGGILVPGGVPSCDRAQFP